MTIEAPLPLREATGRRHEKRYHRPGPSPGTLLQPDIAGTSAMRCCLVEAGKNGWRMHEFELADVSAVRPLDDAFLWLDIAGIPRQDQLAALGERFNIHHLALEDVVNQGQRPKVDDYVDCVFVILSRPAWVDRQVHFEQVSFFMGERFVISISPVAGDPFAPIRLRLKERTDRFGRGGAAYLLHAVVDLTIDEYFPVLDALGENIEAVELELLDHPTHETLAHIHSLKRELLLVRRQLWPTREAVNRLLRYEGSLFGSNLIPYFKDVYDHGLHLIDLVESYRDRTAGMLDVYLSSASFRLNEIMRVLTMIATIFIPLTFITSVYGMNFVADTESPWAMPELHWYYGYPLVWLLIVVVAAGMLVLFKRKRWL